MFDKQQPSAALGALGIVLPEPVSPQLSDGAKKLDQLRGRLVTPGEIQPNVPVLPPPIPPAK